MKEIKKMIEIFCIGTIFLFACAFWMSILFVPIFLPIFLGLAGNIPGIIVLRVWCVWLISLFVAGSFINVLKKTNT